MVIAEFSGGPGFSAKSGYRGKGFANGDFHFIHRAVAAERDAANRQRQLCNELGGAIRRDNERADWHAADGHGLLDRQPLLPQA